MRERYLCMIHLRDRLTELYQLIGLDAHSVHVAQRSALLQWFETLFQDNNLYDYLEGLTDLTDQAVVAMKDRNLDDWNNRCNEARLAELEQQLSQLRLQLTQAEQQLTAKAEAQASAPADNTMQAIRGIISMRDNLLMKKAWAKDCMPQDVNAAKLVDSQLLETAKLLTQLGVEILEDTGAFDSKLHTVVQTLPAQSSEQVDTIAETFRPGYRWNGEIIRPQEVILFAQA